MKTPNTNHQAPSINNLLIFVLISIGFSAILVYSNSITNDFVYFDDDIFVINNENIKGLSFRTIHAIFSQKEAAHYHPLSSLSYALDYETGKLNPAYYHITNLFIHLCNILLVFLFTFSLLKDKSISLIATLLFSIHPMGCESVAWIASRSTLLFTFFYLISLLLYDMYIRIQKNKYYILSIFIFILSLMSKSPAVTLPLLLIIIDIHYKRNVKTTVILEKIPFFLIAFISGLITIFSAKLAETTEMVNHIYSGIDRFFLSTYSFSFYLFKYILPVSLSPLHFPPPKINDFFPILVYISSLLLPASIITILYLLKKSHYKFFFGFTFFLFSIIVFLQIFPIGKTLTTERYAYLPYIGLLIITGAIFSKYKKQSFILLLIPIISISFSVLSKIQNNKWKDGLSLFNNVIAQNPSHHYGYYGRANSKLRMNQISSAIDDYNMAISIKPNFVYAYNNRGNAKFKLKDYNGAINDYNIAIELNSNNKNAYNNRRLANLEIQKAISKNINTEAIDKTEKNLILLNQGLAKFNEGKYLEAIEYFSKSIKIKNTFTEAYKNRANTYAIIGNYNKAKEDFYKITILDPNEAQSYFDCGNIEVLLKNYSIAIKHYNKCIDLDSSFKNAFFNRGSTYFIQNKTNDACSDWGKAKSLGHIQANDKIIKHCK